MAAFWRSFRPSTSARIVDNTSWSCVHGIERWRSNCGCNGGKPGCNQLGARRCARPWTAADAVVPLTEQEGGKLFKDVWAARDGYIEVVPRRGEESVERFSARMRATFFLTQSVCAPWN